MADNKPIFQEITQEQFDWIEKNFSFRQRMEYEKLDFYGTTKGPLFQLLKDSNEEFYLSFAIEYKSPKKRVAIDLIKVNNNLVQYGGQVSEKNPRRLLERVMRHYPPNTNIYERETAKNSMIELGSKLKRKDEEPPKPKTFKI